MNTSTTTRRDGNDTALGAWIRSQPELDSRRYGYDLEDIDRIQSRQYFWHNYFYGYLALIEEKSFMRKRTFAQEDTQSVVDQMLRFASSHPACKIKRLNPNRPVKIRYCGYYFIQFEHNGPEDGRIYLNHQLITPEDLLRFLKFEWVEEESVDAISGSPPLQAFGDQTLADLQAFFNECLYHNDLSELQETVDHIYDLLGRYGGLLSVKKPRVSRLRASREMMIAKGQLPLWEKLTADKIQQQGGETA